MTQTAALGLRAFCSNDQSAPNPAALAGQDVVDAAGRGGAHELKPDAVAGEEAHDYWTWHLLARAGADDDQFGFVREQGGEQLLVQAGCVMGRPVEAFFRGKDQAVLVALAIDRDVGVPIVLDDETLVGEVQVQFHGGLREVRQMPACDMAKSRIDRPCGGTLCCLFSCLAHN